MCIGIVSLRTIAHFMGRGAVYPIIERPRAALGILFIATIPLRIPLYLALYNSYGHLEISIVGAAIASLLTSLVAANLYIIMPVTGYSYYGTDLLFECTCIQMGM